MGRRTWGGQEERELAHTVPLYVPGGSPENTGQKMVHEGIIYCTSTVNEALYLVNFY